MNIRKGKNKIHFVIPTLKKIKMNANNKIKESRKLKKFESTNDTGNIFLGKYTFLTRLWLSTMEFVAPLKELEKNCHGIKPIKR